MASRPDLARQSWTQAFRHFKTHGRGPSSSCKLLFEIVRQAQADDLDHHLYASTSLTSYLYVSSSHRHDDPGPSLRLSEEGSLILIEEIQGSDIKRSWTCPPEEVITALHDFKSDRDG